MYCLASCSRQASRKIKMNITTMEVIDRIEFGLARLKDADISAAEQARILRAIGAISRTQYEQLENEVKKETVNG